MFQIKPILHCISDTYLPRNAMGPLACTPLQMKSLRAPYSECPLAGHSDQGTRCRAHQQGTLGSASIGPWVLSAASPFAGTSVGSPPGHC